MDEEYDDPVTEEDLANACSKLLSTNWQEAGRELGLTDAQLDRVKFDYSIEGLDEIIYRMLRKWQQCDVTATKGKLETCLEKFDSNKNKGHIPLELTDEEYEYILLKIQMDMENTYSELELPRVTWYLEKMLPLQEYYVDLKLEGKDKYGNDTLVDIKLEQLFDRIDDKLPNRILIEGHIGYGKTTLICKLASDWAHGSAYIRKKFDLIFVVLLRDFDGDLESSFMEQCDIKDLSISVKKNLITRKEDKILLLMDGYDELSDSSKSILLSVLQKKTYPLMTVIVTSRTEEMHLQEMKKSPLANVGAKSKDYSFISMWNKRIQIKGISEEHRKEFLGKYFKSDPAEIYEKMSHLIGDKISNLYECPLFLLLLAVLIEEEEIQEVSTRTELYKKVFNFIVKRYLERKNLLEEKQEIDIFDFNQGHSLLYSQVLAKFGELTLEKLQMDVISFNKDEVLKRCEGDENILNLGILHKNTSFKRKKLEFSYEPLHKTFLEFLASFYVFRLKHLSLATSTNMFTDKILSLFNSGFLLNSTSLFSSFLVGLLDKDAFYFIDLISQFNGLFHETFLLEIHSEMEKTKKNNEQILKLFPSIWTIFNFKDKNVFEFGKWNWYFNSNLHTSLVMSALENNIIHELIWQLGTTATIPHRFHVSVLQLVFHKQLHHITPCIKDTEISCDELRCDGKLDIASWNTFKLIVSNIDFKVISFKYNFFEDSEVITQFHKEIMEGLWRDLNIKLLECNQIIPEIIKLSETLLKKNTVHSLFGDCRRVTGADYAFRMISFSVQTVVDAAFESDALKRLYFTNFSDFRGNINIDLSKAIRFKRNGWKLLQVDSKVIWKNYENCNEPLFIEGIAFTSGREHQLLADVKVLSACNGLKAISLPTNIFYKFSKNISFDWAGFKTITEIHLCVTASTSVGSFSLLSRFYNVSILTIDTADYKIDSKGVDSLLKGINGFNLDILFFHENSHYYFFANSFFKRVLESKVVNDQSNSDEVKRNNFLSKNLRLDISMFYLSYDSIEEAIALSLQLLLGRMISKLDFFYKDLPIKPFKLFLFNLIDSPEKFRFSYKYSSANQDFLIYDFEKQDVDIISISLLED